MLRGIRRGRGCCDEGVVFSPGTRSRETIATFHIFNTARRKWLKIHDLSNFSSNLDAVVDGLKRAVLP